MNAFNACSTNGIQHTHIYGCERNTLLFARDCVEFIICLIHFFILLIQCTPKHLDEDKNTILSNTYVKNSFCVNRLLRTIYVYVYTKEIEPTLLRIIMVKS